MGSGGRVAEGPRHKSVATPRYAAPSRARGGGVGMGSGGRVAEGPRHVSGHATLRRAEPRLLAVILLVLNFSQGEYQQSATSNGVLLRKYRSVTYLDNGNGQNYISLGLSSLDNGNGPRVCELNVFGTMPKRSKSGEKLKKARQSSPSKRTSIPRTCKTTAPKKKKTKHIYDFDFLSMTSSLMGSTNTKLSEKEKESKTEIKDESKKSDNEELDVVYDLQEEKKNKVYEVINVASDDETPNTITYERLYADNPDNRAIDIPEAAGTKISDKNELSLNELLKEMMKEEELNSEKVSEVNIPKPEECAEKRKEKEKVIVNIDEKQESDNEVVCIAVLDAKTKAQQKKIEEICLSSDTEGENEPTVPPIRLKIPMFSKWSLDNYLGKDSSDSVESSNSVFPRGLKKTQLYPQAAGRSSKIEYCSKSMSDWDSCSSSAKPSSSDESWAAPTDSSKVRPSDDSSSSELSEISQPKNNCVSPSSSDSESLEPASPSITSSSEEEKDVYWKADRESRRKGDIRYEEFTDFGKRIHEGKMIADPNKTLVFKVMSYNVLAQNLLEQHHYLYKHSDRGSLVWGRRWALLYCEIKDENPDILCLQEVEQSYLVTHYAKLLDLGYRWVYKKRTGNYQDGVAVFYKAALFENETQSTVEYYQPGVSVLDRDNVGLVIRLRLKDNPNNAVVIATTHLLYNPRRSDVKLAQVQLLLSEIDRLAYNKDKASYYPVIVTGDFNLRPRNGLYELMTKGHLQYEGTSRKNLRVSDFGDHNTLPRTLLPHRLGVTDQCQHSVVAENGKTKLYHSEENKNPQQSGPQGFSAERFESGTLSHGFKFQSVYPHIKPDGQREASTHHDNWITVDYIFYSTSQTQNEAGSLQLMSRLRLPTQDECERLIRHLPNYVFGSDHLPLVSKFLLRLHTQSATGIIT